MKRVLDIKGCTLLGSGCEGTVYLTPEGYALKIFKDISSAKAEEEILIYTKDSPFYPNSLIRVSNVLIREFVSGKTLYNHIHNHGLSYKLSTQIIDLVEELKALKFKRINVRNAHIFVDGEENIKIIDPRKPFTMDTPYPKDIVKILYSLQVYGNFLSDLKEYRPELASYWAAAYKYAAATRLDDFELY